MPSAKQQQWTKDLQDKVDREITKWGCEMYRIPYPFARHEREAAHQHRMADYLEVSYEALAIMAGEDPTAAQQ